MKHKVKVTVIDKKLYPELQREYCADPQAGACPCYNVGDEFLFCRDEERDDFWHMGIGTLVKTGADPDAVAAARQGARSLARGRRGGKPPRLRAGGRRGRFGPLRGKTAGSGELSEKSRCARLEDSGDDSVIFHDGGPVEHALFREIIRKRRSE